MGIQLYRFFIVFDSEVNPAYVVMGSSAIIMCFDKSWFKFYRLSIFRDSTLKFAFF